MKINFKKLLLILLIIGIIGGGVGYYFYQKPVKNFAESKADFILSANDIFQEFAGNQAEATKKYVTNDKTILINGVIKSVTKNDDKSITVYFVVNDPDGTVSCTFTPEESVKINPEILIEGKNLKVKGQCSGMQELIGKEVILIRCGIEK